MQRGAKTTTGTTTRHREQVTNDGVAGTVRGVELGWFLGKIRFFPMAESEKFLYLFTSLYHKLNMSHEFQYNDFREHQQEEQPKKIGQLPRKIQ